jgi:C4-dicarboxylate-specific signal transduction histidine kinase
MGTSAQPDGGQHLPSLTDVDQALDQVHPQDRERVSRAFEQALAHREPLDVEYRVLADNGEVRWQAAHGRVEADRRLMGVALDISERKRAELQAEQDRAALRHLTRVSLLGQLSASIAHQLNQPLASILSNGEAAQLMLEQEPLDLDELRAICADIVAEDQRAAAVIRQLGTLFKRGEPSLAPTDLNRLAQDTLELLRTNLLGRHVQVEVQLAPELPAVRGDRVQLQQLLLNLLINAADAMAGLDAARRRIVLSTETHGGGVRICVADHGPGLDEAHMDKLFEPFWSSKSEGMGIGLAISRSIATAHQGTLVASNAAHGGALFCLQLPLLATHAQPTAQVAA